MNAIPQPHSHISPLKKLAAHLPSSWQHELKRLRYRSQIHHESFATAEPEFQILDQLVAPGDWVIDVGANVGHYTKRLSDLVGAEGRVIAVEPVPETFAFLSANASLLKNRNVSLINMAASDRTAVVGIRIPYFESGLKNYYEASITAQGGELQVMTFALDMLRLDHRIALIKIDAEGHDPVVLHGLEQLLLRDHPTLIVETSSAASIAKLSALGYASEKLPGSPNLLFRWQPQNERPADSSHGEA